MILHTVQATKDPIESLLSPEMLKIVFGEGATANEPLPIEKAPTPDTPVAPADSAAKEPHPAMLHPAVARCVEANDKTFRTAPATASEFLPEKWNKDRKSVV